MIDNETVKKVAFLSRLSIEENKLEAVKNEFNGILNWVEQLGEVNVDNVIPLVSVNEENLVWREDVVRKESTAQEILANAPSAKYSYFSVPKVVE